jgi:hypothetical protein
VKKFPISNHLFSILEFWRENCKFMLMNGS